MDIATQYAEAIQIKLGEQHKERFPNLVPSTFSVERGQRFDRIVEQQWNNGYKGGTEPVPGQRSVHAFVERSTGNLIKAAGWKAPQKSKTHPSGLAVRFNLSTPAGFMEALSACNLYGGYLYNN